MIKVLKWLDKYLEESLLVILLLGCVLSMGIQIVSRYIFSSSLSWSEEFMRYMFVWSTFLSISFCIKHFSSLKVEILVRKLNKKVLLILNLFIHLLIFVIITILLDASIDIFIRAVESGQKSPALQWPIEYVQSSMMVGFFLAEIRLIQRFINIFILKKGLPVLELEEF